MKGNEEAGSGSGAYHDYEDETKHDSIHGPESSERTLEKEDEISKESSGNSHDYTLEDTTIKSETRKYDSLSSEGSGVKDSETTKDSD